MSDPLVINIADNNQGRLTNKGNETRQDSKINDPSAFRIGSFQGETLGKISGDRLTNVGNPDGQRLERVLIELNELANGEGSVRIYLNVPNGNGDSGQRLILDITSNEIEFRVPVRFSAGIIGSLSGQTSRMYSANGKYVLNLQDDGNFVEYDTHNSADESTWTPIWARS